MFFPSGISITPTRIDLGVIPASSLAPDEVTGLDLWLDSSTGVYTDASKTTPATGDNDQIYVWADQSGNGNDFSQSTSAKRPTLQTGQMNGKDIVRFDGTDDLLRASNFVSDTAGSIVYVCEFNSTMKDSQNMLSSSDEASTTYHMWLRGRLSGADNEFHLYQRSNDTNDINYGDTPPAVSTPYVIIAMSSGTAYRLRANGRENYIIATAGSNTGDWFGDTANRDNVVVGALKRTTESDFLKADVRHVLIYDHELTSDELAGLEAWLLNDAGITVQMSATNASSAQTTPTYDGSGEAVHPDVYYDADGWNGWNYWLAMTPYPGSDDTYENPSLLVSNDGASWEVPSGLTNPVVAKPAGAINSDVNIMVAPDDTMWLIYRETDSSTYDTVYARSSTDGVTWSSATQILTGSFLEFLSPAMIYDGSQYVIWAVDAQNRGVSANVLKKYTCSTPDGTWSSATTCTVNTVPTGQDMWHVDVVLYGTTYSMFLCTTDFGTSSNGLMYYGSSSDGETWTLDSIPLLAPSPSGWDDVSIYRGSGVWYGSAFDLWYSALDSAGEWYIGRTTCA